jgi:hypothetical protein
MIDVDGTKNKKSSAPTPFSASRWQRPKPRPAVLVPLAPLPLPRRCRRPTDARPHDEHHQRRRARRQLGRRTGIHGHAARLRHLQRRHALRREIFHNLKKVLKARAQHRRRRRRRIRSRPGQQHRSPRSIMEAIEASRLQRGRASSHRPGRRRQRTLRQGRRHYTVDGKQIDSAAMVDFPRRLGRQLPHLLDRRRPATKATGTAGNC